MRKAKFVGVAGNGNSDGSAKIARTTIFLTDVLNDNLDALALTTGVAKGEHVRRALIKYIETQEGFDPHRKPKIKVSY